MSELHDQDGSIGVTAIAVNGGVEGWCRWTVKGGYQVFRYDGKLLGFVSTPCKAMVLVDEAIRNRDD